MRFSYFVGLIFWIFCSELSALQVPAEFKRLLRYGEVDDPSFYLSANGKNNLIDEFAQTTGKLRSNPELRCRFPARTKLLQKRKLLAPDNLEKCDGYQKFKKLLNADSVSLVFSSYYLNNPSSAFGHTFLRFNQWSQNGNREFLDHSVDYAANVDTQNSLAYAYRGIFGYFKGVFSLRPYYVQVQQYSAHESRDLWSYELDFSKDEIEMLIDHLWEVGQSYLFYYYLDENCSYHILRSLQVVKPDIKFDWNSFLVIPADTLRALKEAKLIRKVSYRPSIESKVRASQNNFSLAERLEIRKLANAKIPLEIEKIASKDRAKFLDQAISLIDLRYAYETQFPEEPEAQRKKDLLIARSKIPEATLKPEIQTPWSSRPDHSHPSRLLSMGGGFGKTSRGFGSLRFRPSLHDFGDPIEGMPSYAEIEFLDIELKISKKIKNYIRLENVDLFRVSSLTPLDGFIQPFSWNLRVGAENSVLKDCFHCTVGVGELGGGYTLGPLSLLGSLNVWGHPEFEKSPILLGIGPTVVFKLDLSTIIRFYSWAEYRFLLPAKSKHHLKVTNELIWAMDSKWAIAFKYKVSQKEYDIGSNLKYYF